jgi:DNA polymerase I-like protein with 3'-5' exonuclease and polymerase domains
MSQHRLPMPLRYGGAHTHRLSGEWGMNVQNLPTARGSKGKSKLRQSLLAPPGEVVITADLGQIEARLVAWLAKAGTLLAQFRDNKDPYAALATYIFGYPVDRKVQKFEGFVGKTGILGLGYGCGATKFFNMVATQARMADVDLSRWNASVAQHAVDTYRRVHCNIPAAWRTLDRMLNGAWMGKQGGPEPFGPVEISRGKVLLPNGLSLNYATPTMCYDLMPDGRLKGLVYHYGRFAHKIYGAKMLENITQALAWIIIMNAALRLDALGYRFALQVHDELVFLVPKKEVDKATTIIHEELVRPPSWALDLPLAVEVKVGPNYGDLT